MPLQTIKQPFLLTIFGASGDLAQIKIFPALYALAYQKRLPKNYAVAGYARTKMSTAQFRTLFTRSVEKYTGYPVNKKMLADLARQVHDFAGQYHETKSHIAYRQGLTRLGLKKNVPHIAYLSVPPNTFEHTITVLAKARQSKRDDIRVIIEKPFGHDSASAEHLFHFVSRHLREDQFYLLDHYLGKPQVQSILNMRHANRILANIIEGGEVANIQITAFEDVGVGHRIGYFDEVGMVRDMIQSHLLQLLSLVTMTIPGRKTAEGLHREKHNILSAIDCLPAPHNVVLGQYQTYCKEKGVPKNSRTETFAAVRLFLDKQEWANVPIYIRTGKKLNEKHTYVVVELKKFDFQPAEEEPNRLIIEFHPFPRINITLVNLQEGVNRYQEITTADSIACDLEGCLPEHGNLLLDVLKKDHTHFVSFEEVLASWSVVDEIMVATKNGHVRVAQYRDGSRGPKAHLDLPKQDGFAWYDLHK